MGGYMWFWMTLLLCQSRLETAWQAPLAKYVFRAEPLVAASPTGSVCVADDFRLVFLNDRSKKVAYRADYGLNAGQFVKIDGLNYNALLQRFVVYDKRRKVLAVFHLGGELEREHVLPAVQTTPQLLIDQVLVSVPAADALTPHRLMVLTMKDGSLREVFAYRHRQRPTHQLHVAAGRQRVAVFSETDPQIQLFAAPTMTHLGGFTVDQLDHGETQVRETIQTPAGPRVEEEIRQHPFHSLTVDSEDHIWVFGHQTYPDLPVLRFQVYDPSGNPLHSGHLPDHPLTTNGNRLYLMADRNQRSLQCLKFRPGPPTNQPPSSGKIQ